MPSKFTWSPSGDGSLTSQSIKLSSISYMNKGFETDLTPVPNNVLGADCNLNEFPSDLLRNKENKSHQIRTSIPAVFVKNGMKHYGSKNSCHKILNNYNMNVPQGTIYSLLGSSGCGKTTVLSCVVGIKHLSSGEIYVFGKKPGDKGCGVPGKMIGYMPQELALYETMSIGEIIWFYGALAGMTNSEIITKRDFLIQLLDLPDESRKIESLSGGQKRRVSLAVTFVHSPKLLILDEPTVGVDPLLRESIWDHLSKMVSTEGTTVIITTHYVEEARRSQTVGLMRSGRLLVEDNPEKLLREFQVVSMNDIVLKLCKSDSYGSGFLENAATQQNDDIDINCTSVDSSFLKERNDLSKSSEIIASTSSFTKIKALTVKNSLLQIRNLWVILLILLNPPFNIFLINMFITNDPKSLNIGFVNHDANGTFGENTCPENFLGYEGCIFANMSCRFLSKLKQQDETVKLIEFATDEEAIASMDAGRTWGHLSFPQGFSDSLFARATAGINADNETLNGSTINVELDSSIRPVSSVLLNAYFKAYTAFIGEILNDCGYNPQAGQMPINLKPPKYGSESSGMKEFIAPGILLATIFFYPYCSSSMAIILEKNSGTLERTRVAGVHTWELLVAFLITQTAMLLAQALLTFVLITYGFGITIHGSVILGYSLTVLMGLDGISLGFLASAFCTGELEAVILGLAYFMATIIGSGNLWPIEAVPVTMQYFSQLLPCTLPGESLRSIINRGWGLTHSHVWPGFASETGRIFTFWTLTIIAYRIVLSKK